MSTPEEIKEYRKKLELMLEHYQEGIWYDIIKGHFKHSDTRHHYCEIVRSLRLIVGAWKIIEQKSIINSEMLNAVYVDPSVAIKIKDGKFIDYEVIDAQNISLYLHDVASTAVFVN